jgi:hypothetical protein
VANFETVHVGQEHIQNYHIVLGRRARDYAVGPVCDDIGRISLLRETPLEQGSHPWPVFDDEQAHPRRLSLLRAKM